MLEFGVGGFTQAHFMQGLVILVVVATFALVVFEKAQSVYYRSRPGRKKGNELVTRSDLDLEISNLKHYVRETCVSRDDWVPHSSKITGMLERQRELLVKIAGKGIHS